jgi:hypothetical protein
MLLRVAGHLEEPCLPASNIHIQYCLVPPWNKGVPSILGGRASPAKQVLQPCVVQRMGV